MRTSLYSQYAKIEVELILLKRKEKEGGIKLWQKFEDVE
jgi:hypothetical protein